MKRICKTMLIMVLLVFIVSGCNNANHEGGVKAEGAQKPIKLKFAVYQPKTHNLVSGVFEPFMEQVTELTEGQVEFEFYPGEQLGKATDLYQLTSDGVADLGFVVATYTPSYMPITSNLLGIPGLYSTTYEGSMALHELVTQSPVLEADFLNNGVRPILSHALPTNELWTRGPEIMVPEDIKRTKVRVIGEIMNKLVSDLDATPINLSATEAYEGFERGVFDSIGISPGAFNDYGLAEISKFGTEGLSLGGLATNIIINEKTFQGLPENVQEVLLQVGAEITESYAKDFVEYNQNVIQKFKDEGMNVHQLSEDEKAQWQQVYDAFEEKWVQAQKGHDFKKLIDTFRENVEKYQ